MARGVAGTLKPIYLRSKSTSELFEKLTANDRMGLILTFPGAGRVRLRGDALREFLWVLRSQKAPELVDSFLDKARELVVSEVRELDAVGCIQEEEGAHEQA